MRKLTWMATTIPIIVQRTERLLPTCTEGMGSDERRVLLESVFIGCADAAPRC
ncbi:MAG: hypothetical protein NTY87_03480 [Planctomycetia bacterium]|nr:hypothetical protein [Planctomycetia bacterium]